ncbi:MAG: hypothetical protein EA377_01245 [Phycisphaerales bacterium]|nr:MAG: hypothetical protein EA377_01245 [Phycisphaerales bacterium]
MASDKTAVSLLVLALASILTLGCGEERAGRDSILNNSSISNLDQAGSDNQGAGLDFGEDWDRTGGSARQDGQGQRQRQAAGRPSAGRDRTASPAASGGNWAVVLGTFAGDNHQAQAQAALQQMRQISSELNRARVESRERGSMVVYGRYDRPEDQQAQRDLARIREITFEGQPIFGRSFISRVRPEATTTASSRGDNPHSLTAARKQYPNANPLYSLQVAVWGDFDSGGRISLADVQRQAEAYARELRSQGHEAYFHHDSDKRLSIVTVGLFGRNAIDAETGLLSSDVEYVKRNFPAHLINGEEIQEPIDQRRPGRGTRTQKPFLVEVPR